MFVIEADRARGFGVLMLAPPGSDDDWRAYADAIGALNREVTRDVRPVLLQILCVGIPIPSALVRKRLAELRATIRADAINAVVAESAAVRTAQVALDWIRKPHYESSSHADLASALAHVERVLARPLPELRELAIRVRARRG